MVKALALASMLAMSLQGCSTVTGGSFCDIESPRRPDPAEISTMSDRAVEADLAHNLKGQELCGWKK